MSIDELISEFRKDPKMAKAIDDAKLWLDERILSEGREWILDHFILVEEIK